MYYYCVHFCTWCGYNCCISYNSRLLSRSIIDTTLYSPTIVPMIGCKIHS